MHAGAVQHHVSTITFDAMERLGIVLSRGMPLSNCTYEGYRKLARSGESVATIPDLADVVARQHITHKSVVFAIDKHTWRDLGRRIARTVARWHAIPYNSRLQRP